MHNVIDCGIDSVLNPFSTGFLANMKSMNAI